MKKIYALITCFIVLVNVSIKAQYVTIPDANFAAWLNSNIPSAMSNGNQMDTTSNAITSLVSMDIIYQGIGNLEGIQYFDSLKYLNCMDNNLTNLPFLPITLIELNCHDNQLSTLPVLPSSLTILDCSANQLTNLSILPNTLTELNCCLNQLTNLPALPDSLTTLNCFLNQLTSLPVLPNSLTTLNCSNNQLTSLPVMPDSLILLICTSNMLTSLPFLPLGLKELACESNQLVNLPILPNQLEGLACGFNNLTSLPLIPNSLINLLCYDNLLISLPSLPDSLLTLQCQNNNISCFPSFPNSLISYVQFDISGNPLSCLPNHILAMDSTLLSIPLCIEGDTVDNPHGCASFQGITGTVFSDVNNSCLKDSTEMGFGNIAIKLFNNGNLVGQTNSFPNGTYYFSDTLGTYTVKIDTAGMPFLASCNIDSVVTLTNSNSLAKDVNFGVTCKPGYDVGIQSITTSGWVFPGQQHQVNMLAGDMSQWFNLNCAQGTSGQVQFSISGPVSYVGVAPNALVPSIAGNTFTYQISDFGTINNFQAFGLLFITDTTAQSGDTICVNATVTSAGNDNNLSNNSYQFCYYVINSYDPNMKEVYPVNVLPGYQDWFTYTIHFQNTGSAPAFNIRLADTLDSNFDLQTFQVINYSHYNTVSLHNNNLSFRFPNIMLPDSTSNAEGSKGFVQYRIKPKPSLPLGTQIANTAYIYFDYNAPIVTNTTINEFTQTASIKENTQSSLMSIYPNPSTGKYYITLQKAINSTQYNLEVYNLLGELILNQKIQNQTTQIDLSQYPQGTYILKASGANQSFHQRIIKN